MITALAPLLLLVLVSPGAEAKKKGKAAKFVMHGDQTLDVQPFADDATEYHCRLHDSKHGKATKGNPKYCETAGGASVLVVESYGNDDDDEEEDDGGYDATGRRTRMLKGGPKRPKKYVTSIIGESDKVHGPQVCCACLDDLACIDDLECWNPISLTHTCTLYALFTF